MGDLNIDTADKTKDTCNYLSDLCDTFSLTNIINGKTCFKAEKKVHLLMYCLQTSQRVFKRWEILKQVLAIITNSYSLYFILTLLIFHLKLLNIEITKTLMKVFHHDFDQELLKCEM